MVNIMRMKHIEVEPILRQNLTVLTRSYIRARTAAGARKLSVNTLSRYAAGDTPFLRKIMAGEGSFSARKYDEILRWFRENWPAGEKWPEIFEEWPEVRKTRVKRSAQ